MSISIIQNVNLFIDANSIIYDSLDFKQFTNTNDFETIIIENVIQKKLIILLNSLILILLFIAFDGIFHLLNLSAKNRRYNTPVFNKEII